MSYVEGVFRDALRRTPLHPVRVSLHGKTRRLGLKLEQHSPTGSVKDRTAVGLLRQLHRQRSLTPGTVVIESTSGNLGLAMARMLPFIKCSFLAVVDLKTPRSTCRALLDSGAQLVVVDEPDGQGGYLLRRLDTVRRLCAENPNYRWPNQYENWASPDIHMGTTGPEIAEQAGPELKTVYTPVSTGGTFAGIAAFLRSHRPDVAAVVVDVTGSVALGGTAGRRLIPGIGASRRSSFLRPNSYHRAVLVDDIDAIAVCRIVREDLCLTLGGSSGCCISALLADLAVGRGNGFSVCLAADGGTKYLDTLYSDDWAVTQGIHEDLTSAIKRFRYEGLSFAWEPTAA